MIDTLEIILHSMNVYQSTYSLTVYINKLCEEFIERNYILLLLSYCYDYHELLPSVVPLPNNQFENGTKMKSFFWKNNHELMNIFWNNFHWSKRRCGKWKIALHVQQSNVLEFQNEGHGTAIEMRVRHNMGIGSKISTQNFQFIFRKKVIIYHDI